MEKTEEIIKKYVEHGGKLFTVITIDTIRDGGTKYISTREQNVNFYIDKHNKTLHNNYPTSNDNLIKDIELETYLIDRIETYIKRCEDDVIRNKKLLENIKTQN